MLPANGMLAQRSPCRTPGLAVLVLALLFGIDDASSPAQAQLLEDDRVEGQLQEPAVMPTHAPDPVSQDTFSPLLEEGTPGDSPEVLPAPPAEPGPPPGRPPMAPADAPPVVEHFGPGSQDLSPMPDRSGDAYRRPWVSPGATVDGFMPTPDGYGPPNAIMAEPMGSAADIWWSDPEWPSHHGPMAFWRQKLTELQMPLVRESWLYRPMSAGWFMGTMIGSPLIDDWVGQSEGFFGGYRFGWDFDHYWGCEARFGFGSIELYDSQRAIDAQIRADDDAGVPTDSPYRNRYDSRRDGDVLVFDINLVYYPWGDTNWRPYASIGLGMAGVEFDDRLDQRWDKSVFAMPFALGVKYRWDEYVALRFEVTDNLMFSDGSALKTLNNVSIVGGLEVRFGGTRKAYWPWVPGRYYW